MPTNYPKSTDALTNIFNLEQLMREANILNSIANLNDAVRAIQARCGFNDDLCSGMWVHRTVTLTSAAAATPVPIIPAAAVGAARRFFPVGFLARVNGATQWATVATVTIRDIGETPVTLASIAVAALTGNSNTRPDSANVTLGSAWLLGQGGGLGRGAEVVADVVGTGSDLVLQVWGIVR